MADGRHLGFSKIRFLSTATPWTADSPSLYLIWRKNVDRRRNYGPKSKSKMAAVRHLGFVTSSLYDHSRCLFIGLHRPVKFYANPMHSFEDNDDLNFLQIWLEMPIHAPKILVFGGQNP